VELLRCRRRGRAGAEIFGLGGVTNVFLTADFVSVTKDDTTSWDTLLPLVIQTIEGHFGE
jgi:hypothetical protein